MTPTPTTLTSTTSTSTTSTLAPVPPPGDIVQLVKDTATSVVDKVTTAVGQSGKKPTAGPDHQPATTPAVHLPTLVHRVATAGSSAPAASSLPTGTALPGLAPAFPSAWAALEARTPVVAVGLTGAAPATRIQTAAQLANDPTGRGSDVMRGVLIALAVAAAATIGAGHVTVARSR